MRFLTFAFAKHRIKKQALKVINVVNMKVLCLISAVALLLAIPSGWPYDYYILLRWFIFISSLIVGWEFYKSKLQGWALIFGLNAILFNPIIPVYLQKSTWVLIDLASSVLFFLATLSVKKQQERRI